MLIQLFQRVKSAVVSTFERLALLLEYPSCRFYSKSANCFGFYSQLSQDNVLLGYLFPLISSHCNRHKTIIDVGANHPFLFSNSYFFERYFGCNVVAIEPLPVFSRLWSKYRPDAVFVNSAVSEKDSVNLYLCGTEKRILNPDQLSMLTSERKEAVPDIYDSKCLTVPAVRLDSLLSSMQINSVLFCSVDVEGSEINVLRTIDFAACDIAAFLIENNFSYSSVRRIRSFMKSQGYILVAHFADQDDLYIKRSLFAQLQIGLVG